MKNIFTTIWQRIKCVRSIFNAIFFTHQWKTPLLLTAKLPEMKTSNPMRANEFYEGIFQLNNSIVKIKGDSIFLTKTSSTNWLEALHSFTWLHHLTQKKLSKIYAESLINEWISICGNTSKNLILWQLPLTSRRVIAWCCHSNEQNPIIISSLVKQLRYLYGKIDFAFSLKNKLLLLIALTAGAICTNQQKKIQIACLKKLENQLAKLTTNSFASPKFLIELASYLVALQILCNNLKISTSKNFQNAINVILATLSQLTHANGKIAQFNGETNDDISQLKKLFAFYDGKKINKNNIGYKRLQLNNSVVIADATNPNFNKNNFANSLSFEFSSNNYLFIANNSSTLILNNHLARAKNIYSEYKQNTNTKELWLSHDGYKSQYGFLYKRIFRLSKNGTLFEGRDGFSPQKNKTKNLAWQLYFNIAKEINAELINNKIKLTAADGETWIFTAPNFVPKLQQSKIIVESTLTQAVEIYWRFEKQL